MRKLLPLFILILLLTVYIFRQDGLIKGYVRDNDEGIYATTFLLINRGYPAYTKTFLSQPPGFLISIYPAFIYLGKTLQAARTGVFIISFFGILASVVISGLAANIWSSILTICILLSFQSYIYQSSTLQSDAIAISFSAISIACLYLFVRYKRYLWVILMSVFYALAFWTKFDFFTIVPIVAVFIYLYKKSIIKKDAIFLSVLLFFITNLALTTLLFIFFNPVDLYKNIIVLRIAASSLTNESISLIYLLLKDKLLLFIISITGFIVLTNKTSLRFPCLPLLLWPLTVFIFLLFYHPLYPHHLIMLIFPLAVILSVYLTSLYFNTFLKAFILLFSVIIVYNNIPLKPVQGISILNADQKSAVNVILENTNANDLVVTDEEILNSSTGRLPPPEIADLSYVRIKSGNLTPEKFKIIINKYKPELIIPWNGRLKALKNLPSVLENYRVLTSINGKQIYIRKEIYNTSSKSGFL